MPSPPSTPARNKGFRHPYDVGHMSDAKALAEFEENSARLNTSSSHKRWLLTTPEGRAAYTREQRARLSPKSQVEFDANVAESELENEAEVQKKRSGFARQNEGPNVNTNQQRANSSPNPSPTLASPTVPPLVQQSSFSSNTSSVADNSSNIAQVQAAPEPAKFFFREKYANLGVKGNFMPLAAQPANVGLADWLAHQTVESSRIVGQILLVIEEVDTNTGKPICNPESCPRMAAGRHTYTWLDNKKEPIPVSAPQYISLVQRWVKGKIHDPKAFPIDPPAQKNASTYASGGLNTPADEKPIATDPTELQAPLTALAGREWFGKSAGFPETFLHDVRTCFRQIFRIYAHLYHSHWVDPFWHLSDSKGQGYTDLNSCFCQFTTVAKLYGLLSDKDAEPLQPLIDIWIANGSVPADAARGACAALGTQ